MVLHANDGSDVRIGKVCRSLSAMGFDVHFIGWDRRPDVDKTVELGSAHSHIFTRATALGRFRLVPGLRWFAFVWVCLVRLRPWTVCAVNEEHALVVLPLKRLVYRHLVCDIFDSLADRHSHRSAPARALLRVLTFVGRAGSDRLIATDRNRFERLGRFRGKAIVVGNYPEDPGDGLWRTELEGPIRLYVAGSLTRGRGLEQVLGAVDQMRGWGLVVEVVSAGWLLDSYANEVFVAHPAVRFHGIVSSRRSLELAAMCDAVLAFYAPTSEGNRNASPNKVYDAMSVGRPVIINSEVRMAQWIVDNGLGFAAPYGDVEALAEIIRRLPELRGGMAEGAARIRAAFGEGSSWQRSAERLRGLYEELSS